MRILRRLEAARLIGLHPVHLMRKANDPRDDFPGPIRIGPNAVGFIEAEVEDWLARRAAERPVKNTDPSIPAPRKTSGSVGSAG
jgi:prophage regulatory protein